jgi:hypothetical protein
MLWHILDTDSIWLREFACALRANVPTRNWCPEIRNFGWLENWEKIERFSDPQIEMTRFPLQRGYARTPIGQMLPFGKDVVARLKRASSTPKFETLVCTAPFYAPVAERWPGKIVYYLTDLTKEYAGMNAHQIVRLDRRMCRVASAVCPNSSRIARYLENEAGCDPAKLTVIPNATRQQNIMDRPLMKPAAPPNDIADLQPPFLGIIGNLAGNMDWCLIQDAVEKTRDISWVFVGPTSMRIADPVQDRARRDLLRRGGRLRFVGQRSYGQLARYARAFHVAFMPYRRHEPTYSGSATRFYEHLAACRPMLSSRGFHELLSKEPLLQLVDTGEEVAAAVERLRSTGFQDGLEDARWCASREGTWQVRARDLLAAATGKNRVMIA